MNASCYNKISYFYSYILLVFFFKLFLIICRLDITTCMKSIKDINTIQSIDTVSKNSKSSFGEISVFLPYILFVVMRIFWLRTTKCIFHIFYFKMC